MVDGGWWMVVTTELQMKDRLPHSTPKARARQGKALCNTVCSVQSVQRGGANAHLAHAAGAGSVTAYVPGGRGPRLGPIGACDGRSADIVSALIGCSGEGLVQAGPGVANAM